MARKLSDLAAARFACLATNSIKAHAWSQPLRFDTESHTSFRRPTYSDPAPIASDYCQQDYVWGDGAWERGLATNHVWGGDRYTKVHFATKPLYWGTKTGTGQANFAFDDGSVQQWTGIEYPTLGTDTYSIPSYGVGDHDSPRLPKAWASEYRTYE